jgi:site-specific recombinase XerD
MSDIPPRVIVPLPEGGVSFVDVRPRGGDPSAYANPRRVAHVRAEPLLPLLLPTIEHLEERLADVRTRAVTVEGLQHETVARWLTAARSFIKFLRSNDTRRAFLSGDYRMQTRIAGDWVAWLREHGVSRTSIATYWRSMDAQLRRVEREDGVLNPLTLIKAPAPGTALPRSLTRAQAERVVLYVRNRVWSSNLERTRNVCVIALMLFAGLRRGEVIRLHVADCNVFNGTITVRNGKGRNGGRTRTSYMTPQLQDAVTAYLEAREAAVPERTHPELLTSVAGDLPMSIVTVRRLFEYIHAGTGISISPHMLRHTYALLLRQAGIPDRVSMDLMGHKSLAMLQRYSHVFDGEHQREAAKVHLDVEFTDA